MASCHPSTPCQSYEGFGQMSSMSRLRGPVWAQAKSFADIERVSMWIHEETFVTYIRLRAAVILGLDARGACVPKTWDELMVWSPVHFQKSHTRVCEGNAVPAVRLQKLDWFNIRHLNWLRIWLEVDTTLRSIRAVGEGRCFWNFQNCGVKIGFVCFKPNNFQVSTGIKRIKNKAVYICLYSCLT